MSDKPEPPDRFNAKWECVIKSLPTDLRSVDPRDTPALAAELLADGANEIDRLRTDLAASNARVAELEAENAEMLTAIEEGEKWDAQQTDRLTRQRAVIEAMDEALSNAADTMEAIAEMTWDKRQPDQTRIACENACGLANDGCEQTRAVARTARTAMEGESCG